MIMGNSKVMAKTKLRVAAVLSFLVLCTGLVGCFGPSDEEIIKEGFISDFESIKSLNIEELQTTFGSLSDEAELASLGISDAEFYGAWLEGFDYVIDDVSVNGNTATTTVTITCKPLASALSTWEKKLTDMVAEDEGIYDMSEEDRQGVIKSALIESFAVTELATNTIEIPCMLDDNLWQPMPGYESVLQKAFMGEA